MRLSAGILAGLAMSWTSPGAAFHLRTGDEDAGR